MWIGVGVMGVAMATATTMVARQQSGMQGNKMTQGMAMSANNMTKAQKIANAKSAAPAAIADGASVFDYPAKEGEQPTLLLKGTNGYSCFPDMPDTKGNDPVCADGPWLQWMQSYMSHKAPSISTLGIAYMTAEGGAWGSNTDPYGMTETPTNHWGLHKPHVMIVTPDLKSLAGISTDPANGGPYVMYAGTPYAHIMAPIKK
jgi:hypothetical protein